MSGELVPGRTLRFATDATAGALVFEPVVQEVRPNEHLGWEGSLVVPGLVDGEHVVELEPIDGGATRVAQSEHFRGIFVPFLTGWLDDNTRPDFLAMNESLSVRSEAVAAGGS